MLIMVLHFDAVKHMLLLLLLCNDDATAAIYIKMYILNWTGRFLCQGSGVWGLHSGIWGVR